MSFVGMGLRGGWASFHICAWSLAPSSLFPLLVFLPAQQGHPGYGMRGSVPIPSLLAPEWHRGEVRLIRKGWSIPRGNTGESGGNSDDDRRVVILPHKAASLSRLPCHCDKIIHVSLSQKEIQAIWPLCVWLYSPDFAIYSLELYFFLTQWWESDIQYFSWIWTHMTYSAKDSPDICFQSFDFFSLTVVLNWGQHPLSLSLW